MFYDPFDTKQNLLPWKTIVSEHYTYYYQTDPADNDWSIQIQQFDGTRYIPLTESPDTQDIDNAARAYVNHFENWYAALKPLFETNPSADKPLPVYNYTSKEQQIEYSGGSADMFIDYSLANGGGTAIHLGHEGVCGHELIHIFQASIGNAPALLMEGMAVALGGAHWESNPDTYVDLPTLPLPQYSGPVETAAWQNYPLHALAGHVAGFRKVETWSDGDKTNGEKPFNNTTLRPKDLMFWGSNFSNMWYTYCLGGSFVHFLVTAYGWEPFMEVYSHAVNTAFIGNDIFALFADAYGKSFDKLQNEWQKMLEAGGTHEPTNTDLSQYWS